VLRELLAGLAVAALALCAAGALLLAWRAAEGALSSPVGAALALGLYLLALAALALLAAAAEALERVAGGRERS